MESFCSSGKLTKAELTCSCSLIEPEGHSHTLHQHSDSRVCGGGSAPPSQPPVVASLPALRIFSPL